MFFFIKIATDDGGRAMLQGKYEAMLAIHKTVFSFAPKPVAWGAYKDVPATYFFIRVFIDMIKTGLPDPGDFCSNLAKLHKTSVSPTGKFEFGVVTGNGTTSQKWIGNNRAKYSSQRIETHARA